MKNVKLLILIGAVVVLAVLFFLLKSDAADPAAKVTDVSISQEGQARVVKLTIENGKLTTADTTVRARQNEKITLEVLSDVADELHLHGYDKTVDLAPGKTGRVTFVADKSGSFEAELHKAESTVFVLEVQPQ